MKIGANFHITKNESFNDRFSAEKKSVIRGIEPHEVKSTAAVIKDDIKNNWHFANSSSDDITSQNKKIAAAWEAADLISEIATEVEQGEADNQFTACFINDNVIGVMAWTREHGTPGLYIDSILAILALAGPVLP